ncbi:MAG TPA: ABC transporter ATP-binding protein [Bacteroidales bacterium]|nr:ABC transporter ATP-binding protein [Bacteroidales bacterium]HOX78182.1 ABC transporter ATP-binding protein [Bacteroidales bacterium]HPI87595.1 ABC transporter ATP-binding protein [Bacteroidales bacterium]HPM92935.1 ABC transporter ATP-binding protein [Bacteroidales bacterium]
MKIIDLHKAYGRFGVLKGVDLELKDRAITAVLGPNGSGKTTLIKCLLGMVIGQKGDILYHGEPVGRGWAYRSDIGYLPQIARFPENLKVKELVAMIRDIRNQPAETDALVALFGLDAFMNKPLRQLSGGTRQKVNILIAFMFDSPVYILDEPTVGLDPVALIRFKELLLAEKRKGKAILMTTHIVHLVEELADEVVFLLEGKVYFKGDVKALKELNKSESLEEAIAKILELEKHV